MKRKKSFNGRSFCYLSCVFSMINAFFLMFSLPFVVSKVKEVDSQSSFCMKPVDLNHFFGEDGKIYGYQGLKVT